MKKVFILIITVLIFSCAPVKKNTLGYKLNPDVYKIVEEFKNGYLFLEVPYNEDLEIDGVVVQYYREGNVQITYTQKNGKKNGPAVWYYENGQKYLEVNYIDDEFDGVLTKYYDSGKLQSHTPYKNGELMSGTVEYNQLGEKLDSIEIIIERKNTLSYNNKYEVTFSLSEDVSNVLYYYYRYENDTLTKYRFNTENHIGSYVVTVMKGMTYSNNFHLVAIGETVLENRFLIETDFSINIRN